MIHPPKIAVVDALLDKAERRYVAERPRSQAHMQRASDFLPGGNSRTVLFFKPFPLVIDRSAGCSLWDIDGHEYTDFLGEYTAGLFGHSDTIIRSAIVDALDNGLVHGGHIENEANLAELLCARFKSLDRIRFCNSGTEANLMAITTARIFTKRPKVMVFKGGYHGGVLVFKEGDAPQNAPFPFVVGKYNDAEGAMALIEDHKDELACVLVEPLQGAAGCIPGKKAFLAALREACSLNNIVLIFDEVMTSRLSSGGLQQVFDIVPDMTTLGKYIGGGATFGAFGGDKEIMDLYDPNRSNAISHAGTFNNSAITMAAGFAAMSKIYTPERASALNASGDKLRNHLNAVAVASSLPMQVTGLGSIMNVHFCNNEISSVDDIREDLGSNAKALLHLELLLRGKYSARRGMINLSLPIGDSEIAALVAAFDEFTGLLS